MKSGIRKKSKTLPSLLRTLPRATPSYPSHLSVTWVSVRQASQWRREIDLAKAGKLKPPTRDEGWIRDLRQFAFETAHLVGDICLMPDGTLVRFLGVAQDPDDYYYVVDTLRRARSYYSAVGDCLSLKNQMEPTIYNRLERLFDSNGAKAARKILILRQLVETARPRAPRRGPAKKGH